MAKIPENVEKFMEVDKNSASLKISRLPLPTFNFFIELSKKEFCGDYGMCLKWLIDNCFDNRFIEVYKILEEHAQIINGLINKPEEKEAIKKQIKLLSGKSLEVKSGG